MFDSIKKAFTLSPKAVKVFCVLVVFNLIVNVVNLFMMPASAGAEINLQKSLAVMGTGFIFFLAAIFMQGGVISYVRDLLKAGSASLEPFVVNCAKYFLRMLSLVLITMVIILGWGLLLFGVLPAFLPVMKIAFFIIGIAVIVGFMILLILPGYALVAGELSVVEALRKGVSVAVSNFLKMTGVLIILIVISIVVMFLGSFITGLLSIVLKQAANYAAAVVMAVSSAIITLMADIAYVDFYLKNSKS